MPTLTVFTPTYNRAYTLHLCYESLCRQTSKDFCWLIIDDGSTDNTKALVERWIKEGKVPITYFYQENQGMHGAHNTAYKLIDTELNTCIDSDDYMPDDAVETIVSFWKENGSDSVAGIIGLDVDFEGNIIGNTFPADLTQTTIGNFYCHGGRGDKKVVYRTDVVKRYPEYPVFEGEKYGPMGVKRELIDQDYELLILNKPLCCVCYMPDGSSLNMYRQYIRNPKGFAYSRKQSMVLSPTAKRRFIEAVHYVSSSIMLRNGKFIQESPRPWLVLCAIPLGLVWYGYIRFKTRNVK